MASVAVAISNDEDNYSPSMDEDTRKVTCCGRWIERGSVRVIMSRCIAYLPITLLLTPREPYLNMYLTPIP